MSGDFRAYPATVDRKQYQKVQKIKKNVERHTRGMLKGYDHSYKYVFPFSHKDLTRQHSWVCPKFLSHSSIFPLKYWEYTWRHTLSDFCAEVETLFYWIYKYRPWIYVYDNLRTWKEVEASRFPFIFQPTVTTLLLKNKRNKCLTYIITLLVKFLRINTFRLLFFIDTFYTPKPAIP